MKSWKQRLSFSLDTSTVSYPRGEGTGVLLRIEQRRRRVWRDWIKSTVEVTTKVHIELYATFKWYYFSWYWGCKDFVPRFNCRQWGLSKYENVFKIDDINVENLSDHWGNRHDRYIIYTRFGPCLGGASVFLDGHTGHQAPHSPFLPPHAPSLMLLLRTVYQLILKRDPHL